MPDISELQHQGWLHPFRLLMLLAQEQVRLLERQRVANITSDRVHSSVDVMVPAGCPGVF